MAELAPPTPLCTCSMSLPQSPAFVGYDARESAHDEAHQKPAVGRPARGPPTRRCRSRRTWRRAVPHVVVGQTVDVINATADTLNASVIVLVGHRHNLAHRLVLGSVTDRLLKTAKRPVLVLPDPEHGPARLQTFELDHPDITRAINDVSLFLSGLGI
ncbi:MAG: universal stress protein [Acidimicrobiales bacterium]